MPGDVAGPPLIQINVPGCCQEKPFRQPQPASANHWMQAMRRNLQRVLVIYAVVVLILVIAAAFADDRPASRAIQEEV